MMRDKNPRLDARRVAMFAEANAALIAAFNPKPVEVDDVVFEEPTREHRVIRAPVHHRPLLQHLTTMRFSVQNSWGGNRFVFSHSEKTISELECRSAAERLMNKAQYINVVHLETIRS